MWLPKLTLILLTIALGFWSYKRFGNGYIGWFLAIMFGANLIFLVVKR